MSRQNKIVICSFVVGIIAFVIVNIIHFELYNMLYLLMLVVYFVRFLYNKKQEKKLRNSLSRWFNYHLFLYV